MTTAQLALAVLGYLPKGYILVTENHNTGAPYRVGVIHAYIDGKGGAIASFRIDTAF